MNWYVIVVGVCMLLASFATINSASSTKFDHDLSLLLMLAGGLTVAIGTGILDVTALKDLMP